ncbi:MAG: CapA family protein [Lentisphaerae bacterium]|nr:CapA family protein [Lentisphaerota bacterium]
MKFVDRCCNWREKGAENYSILFAGDICPRATGLDAIMEGKVAEVFKEVKPVFDAADLRVVQWETTITESETPIDKTGPNLKVPYKCAEIISHLKADVALLANNHIGDFGPDAALETIERVQAAGAKAVGAGKNIEDAAKPLILTCGNITISLLNYGENEYGAARENRAGVATLAIFKILDQIRAEKAKGNLVFIAIHGGHETNPFPSPRMVETYRAFIDAGADLLWNCHTHCPEGIELWNGKPIVYCPGNFFFPAGNPEWSLPTWFGGYLVTFKFDAQGVYGMEVTPYQQIQTSIELFDAEREKKFFDYLDVLSSPLSDPAALQHWFDIWCSGSGLYHVRSLGAVDQENWEPDWRNRDVVKRHLGVRNINTCESHHDMVRRTLLLIERYEITALKDEKYKVQELQKPDWIRPL